MIRFVSRRSVGDSILFTKTSSLYRAVLLTSQRTRKKPVSGDFDRCRRLSRVSRRGKWNSVHHGQQRRADLHLFAVGLSLELIFLMLENSNRYEFG
ncbi:hypothetical protein TNCV_3816791 [Trichonephila clavipes]|nr:hypothetical protein TNCV_3816791 [Trichonephila clavipes]